MKSLPLILALAFSTAAQAGVDIQRWTTGNGTEVLLVEQHDNPIVDMQVNFKGAGSVFNPEGKSEVAEFTAALLTDGTEKLDEEAFNAVADDIAAQIDSGSGQESSAAVLRSLSRPETLKKAAGLLNQSLTHPRFDPAVFDRRQKEAVTTLQQQETTPDFTAGRALTKLAYPDHPYGSGANVTAESIRKVNLDDIRAFHRSRYGKDNAIVAIVGDINRKQADQLVKNVLNGLPDRSKAAHTVPPVKPNPAQRRNIPFAGEQAQVLLGMPLIKRHDPDYYALVAGNYILGGGGFDSRLMKVLRDRYGYTYGDRSGYVHHRLFHPEEKHQRFARTGSGGHQTIHRRRPNRRRTGTSQSQHHRQLPPAFRFQRQTGEIPQHHRLSQPAQRLSRSLPQSHRQIDRGASQRRLEAPRQT